MQPLPNSLFCLALSVHSGNRTKDGNEPRHETALPTKTFEFLISMPPKSMRSVGKSRSLNFAKCNGRLLLQDRLNATLPDRLCEGPVIGRCLVCIVDGEFTNRVVECPA